MEINERIAQWEKMTREVPDDMAWFSLGTAYKEANRLEDAAAALAKAIEINPGMSRAYHLRGQVLIQIGRSDEATQLLTEGYGIAAQRGDVMPQKAMGSLLEKIGQPIPMIEQRQKQSDDLSADQVIDRRTGRPGTRLPDPPLRGPLGRFIYDHYSQETWQEWIGQGTKVINELRLDFSNVEHQGTYDSHMVEWLGISQEDVDTYTAQLEKAEKA